MSAVQRIYSKPPKTEYVLSLHYDIAYLRNVCIYNVVCKQSKNVGNWFLLIFTFQKAVEGNDCKVF